MTLTHGTTPKFSAETWTSILVYTFKETAVDWKNSGCVRGFSDHQAYLLYDIYQPESQWKHPGRLASRGKAPKHNVAKVNFQSDWERPMNTHTQYYINNKYHLSSYIFTFAICLWLQILFPADNGFFTADN